MTIFAILGVQLFAGKLRQRCIDPSIPHEFDPRSEAICSEISWTWSACENATLVCEPVGPNPDYGFSSFDHFASALFKVFQVITFDEWQDIYNEVG